MAGRLQGADVKSLAEVGNVKSRLTPDSKLYVSQFALDKLVSESIRDFDIGTGDSPLRMYAAETPDSKLYFKGNARQILDGSSKITTPIDDNIGSFPDSSINWQTGAITGGSFFYQGTAFSFPSTTVGEHRRFAFALQSNGTISVNYSSAVSSVAFLPNAGILFSALEGQPIGYIDLEATAATAFKTSGSATDVIEAKVGGVTRIWWFGAGGGGGGGGDISFKLQAINSNIATIKKGSIMVDSQIELYAAANFTANLTSLLSPAASTQYYLYVDLWSLGAETSVGNSDRKVYAVSSSNLVILATKPSATNPRRYVPLASLKTDGSSDYTLFDNLALRRHDSVAAFVSEPQVKTYTLTTAVASDITAHNLVGEPQVVNLFYYDGSKKVGLDPSGHLLNKGSTNIEVATLGLTFGGGQYVEVQAIYYPNQAGNVVSLQHDFVSGWYENTATTTVPHGLQSGSIKGYEVQEWDVTAGKIRNIDRSGLVVNFDDTNFYLNWTGLSPSSTLKYRVVAGGTPIPAFVPIEFGGFNKFVGFGPGSYTTLAAAVAAAGSGDAILVNQSHSLAADLDINVANIRIAFMPGVIVTVAGALTNGVRLTAAGIKMERPYFKFEPTGAQARGISVEAADCDVDRAMVELNTAQTLTDAVHITAGGLRAYVRARVKVTLGTVTNLLTNNNGASSAEVWGG